MLRCDPAPSNKSCTPDYKSHAPDYKSHAPNRCVLAPKQKLPAPDRCGDIIKHRIRLPMPKFRFMLCHGQTPEYKLQLPLSAVCKKEPFLKSNFQIEEKRNYEN